MISHDLKCIFIHIPRCAGTSIEKWLVGANWWEKEASTKHLIASQAQRLYQEYWDTYFKFSIVRHPISRVISSLKFHDHFGLELMGRRICFAGYYERFGRDVIVEFDHRYAERADVLQPEHRQGAVYGNILDRELDFVGKFEDLKGATQVIADRLSISSPFFDWEEKSLNLIQASDLDEGTLSEIRRLYFADYARWGYKHVLPIASRTAQLRILPVVRPPGAHRRQLLESAQQDD
jgi:Sulfotransferase family